LATDQEGKTQEEPPSYRASMVDGAMGVGNSRIFTWVKLLYNASLAGGIADGPLTTVVNAETISV